MTVLLFVVLLVFALRREMTYLHIFQQEEYDGRRFVRWIVTRLAVDKRATAILLILWIVQRLWHLAAMPVDWGASIALAVLTAIETDPRKKAKKPLAMTPRANRTYSLALALFVAAAVAVAVFAARLPLWIAAIQFIPFTLVLANLILQPFEARVQKRFWNEAHEKLLRLKPTTIGITGSFGKTSVKHILSHILGANAPTLATPGSVNTPMGIARVVREQLGTHHRFFICEMGAYGPGSIARLCRLAGPDLAAITAIGPAHYERFKSLEAVVRTKFELASATVDRGGKVVLNEEILQFAYAREFYEQHKEQFVLVGASPRCHFRIGETRQTAEGIEADVEWLGKTYCLSSHLFGRHHALNLGIAFAVACVLGVPAEDVLTAIKSAPQIAHRLEVKHEPGGQIVIDDAYNSNPTGFANGLQILDLLRNGTGRRILVTPGMVELGAVHDEEHRKAGLEAGKFADVLLAVLPGRIGTLIRAFKEANPQGEVVECATFAQAQEWMQRNLKPADVVLLENDLPDLYERKLRL